MPLFDGISEAGLAGLLDPTDATLNVRSSVMAPERTVVRSTNALRRCSRRCAACTRACPSGFSDSRRPGSPYARWYTGQRVDALRGHDPDFTRRVCPACHGSVSSLFPAAPALWRFEQGVRRLLPHVGRQKRVGWLARRRAKYA